MGNNRDYLEEILLEDERVLTRIPFGKEYFIFLLIFMTYFFVFFWLVHLLINLWHPLAGKIFLFLTGSWLVKRCWLITYSEYVVTDRRIIDKERTSFFSEEIKEFFLHRVERITFKKSGILDRILDFGSFEISGSGNKFRVDVPKPGEFHRMLNEAIIAAKERERRIGRNRGKGKRNREEEKVVSMKAIR